MTGSDVEVMVNEGRFYRYPDLVVSCDQRDRQHETFYEFSKLIVEVLSDSTEAIDRGDKFQEYIQILTLEEYILVSTQRMQVECYRRGEDRMWLYVHTRLVILLRFRAWVSLSQLKSCTETFSLQQQARTLPRQLSL